MERSLGKKQQLHTSESAVELNIHNASPGFKGIVNIHKQ